jgi:hypothetical protein
MTRLTRITLLALAGLALTAPVAAADDVQSFGGYTFTISAGKPTDNAWSYGTGDNASSYGTGDINPWSYGTG